MESTGIAFTNTLSGANAGQNQIRLNGSGVALGDVDGDGWCDIFCCSLEGHLALFRNLGGWKFTNWTAAAGLDLPGNWSTGATLADVDGDGDLDLLVNSIGGGTKLFYNDGRGHFSEAPQSGLSSSGGAMTAALADLDGSGRLDLYVANYRTNTVRSTGFAMLVVDGKRMVRPEDRGMLELTPEGRVIELGEPDVVYRNDGKGHFKAVSWTDGTFLDERGQPLKEGPREWGLTAAFRDLNGDGLPDLYVCNDFQSPDRIWLNNGKGHFREAPRLAFRHTATFSMSADFADVDRDGKDDILVSDMTSRDHARRLMQIAGMEPYELRAGAFADRPQLDRTVLQWNRGDGTYAEIAHFAGLENSEWNWSVLFLDLDLDGFEDVFASTGHMFDTQDLDAQMMIDSKGPYPPGTLAKKLLMLPPLNQPKLAFRNNGDLTFSESSASWGFNQTGVSHGMALADLDNDGDLDLVVNNLNGALGVYQNMSSAPRVAVRLKGQGGNTRGIGAKIVVKGGPVTQSQEMMCGGRYLSCDDAMRVFAAGKEGKPLTIEVTWRRGNRSVVENAQANCLYEVDESGAQPIRSPPVPALKPMFEEVSPLLGHSHVDEAYDDFGRQPLLPRQLSQLGPGVCWWDLDGDGWEDLVIGSGKGGTVACYQNDGKGGFKRVSLRKDPVKRDTTGIVGWGKGVLVGTANYEDGQASGNAVELYESGQVKGMVEAWKGSVGPVAVADYDGDGWLDVFVGARVTGGQYPLSAGSRLYRQQNGKLELDEENGKALAEAGMVSGAVWSDLDGDGWPELVLATEWGPVRVYRNEKGKLKEVTRELGLAEYTGWWTGVTAGDFDGDGRMDLVVGNWGRNTKYERYRQKPLRLYYGDWVGDGSQQLLEAVWDGRRYVPNRMLDHVGRGIPFLQARYTTHQSWAETGMEEVLAAGCEKPGMKEVRWLESALFLNRGDHFEVRELPVHAQLSPCFGACVGDYDGDGKEDVFVSQNFFGVDEETSRYDGGRGLWLRGDGSGGLKEVEGQESGVKVYGEGRGAALCDYDGDGRVDLVVGQNRGETRLFRNVGGKAGLRVKLKGGEGNSHGIGALIRVKYEDGLGPAREVHGGSGYWSQDSVVEVLGVSGKVTAVEVRWPGGKISTASVREGEREITIGQPD